MKKLLLPLIMLLVGTGAGVGAGIVLKPAPEPVAEGEEPAAPSEDTAAEVDPEAQTEYAKLNNQFVVPVVRGDQIVAMVVLSLSVEIPFGKKDSVFSVEPKLRAAFLEALFSYANIGGFSGNFTAADNLRILREDLLRRAVEVIGADALDVLILDIIRQDT